MAKIFSTIKGIVDAPRGLSGLSRRVVCLLRDVLELRDRNWRLRDALDGTSGSSKTFDEINREAAEADRERQQYSDQMSVFPLRLPAISSALVAPVEAAAAADPSDSITIGVLQPAKQSTFQNRTAEPAESDSPLRSTEFRGTALPQRDSGICSD